MIVQPIDMAEENRRLRIRVRELEDELAEWARRPAALGAAGNEIGRLHRLRQVLGCADIRWGAARMINAMLDHPGRLFSKEALLDACVKDFETARLKIVDIYVCRLRKAIHAQGLPGEIQTVWGDGYILSHRLAAAIEDRLEQRP